MLNAKIAERINDQINKEFYSAYLYLDMANYYKEEGLEGFANWYQVQAREESDHALMFLDYLQNNGGKVTLEAIAKPDKVFRNQKDPLEISLQHERYVTGLINEIYDLAYSEKDFRTMQFLDWFVKEQGEEEMNSENLIKKYDLFAGDPKGLYLLDSELESRSYATPNMIR